MFRCLDAFRGFLLKRVDYPNVIRQLHRVDDTERITHERQRDFKYAGAEALQRFRDIRLATLRRDGQGCEADELGAFGKGSEFLQCRLDPRYRARLPDLGHQVSARPIRPHIVIDLILSYLTTGFNGCLDVIRTSKRVSYSQALNY